MTSDINTEANRILARLRSCTSEAEADRVSEEEREKTFAMENAEGDGPARYMHIRALKTQKVWGFRRAQRGSA